MNNDLKKRVMVRIYLEYSKDILRRYSDYFMFGLFVAASLTLVSVRDVLTNMPKSDLPSAFNFFKVAILNTSWIIQALLTGFFLRAIIAGVISAYKNINNRWPAVKLIKLRY